MKRSDFSFLIDTKENCIFIKHFGVYNVDISLARSRAIGAHDDYRPGLNRLLDVTECIPGIDTGDIETISTVVGKEAVQRGNYKEAVLVSNLVGHGIVRMIDSMKKHSGVQYQIFRQDDANVETLMKNWLEITADFKLPDFLKD